MIGAMRLFGRAHADGDRLSVAGVVVRLKVNNRARRISLRLDRARREVVATAPSLRRLAEAVAFAHDRAGWIAEKVAELPEPSPLGPGMEIFVLGEPCRLELARSRPRWVDATDEHPSVIEASGTGDAFAMGVVRVLRRRALDWLCERTTHHALAFGQPQPRVSVMDAKGRWGSCRADPAGGPGVIRYSWRLVLAPAGVADYVVAHECAHLLEQNHGPRFWALVRARVGDVQPHRAWLAAEAARLHAFGQPLYRD